VIQEPQCPTQDVRSGLAGLCGFAHDALVISGWPESDRCRHGYHDTARSTNVRRRRTTTFRRGSHNDRIVAVESGGNEYIAEADRHCKPSQLFWTCASPNLEFATIFVGVLAVTFYGKASGLEPVTWSAFIKERLDAITVG